MKRPLNFYATDIHSDALDIAKYNWFLKSFKHSQPHKVDFEIKDRLADVDCKFDFIISNPPYIKASADRAGVHGQVDQFEPHLALYLPDLEYDKWFQVFFKQVYSCLNISGHFLMEGHEDHLKSLKNLSENMGFTGEVIQDYTHRDRFLLLTKDK
jgi:release factor glutamine methyltransferase